MPMCCTQCSSEVAVTKVTQFGIKNRRRRDRKEGEESQKEKSREKGGKAGGIDKDKEERGIRKNIGRREKLYGIGEDRETERLEG